MLFTGAYDDKRGAAAGGGLRAAAILPPCPDQ
jgi:hypothetical protein